MITTKGERNLDDTFNAEVSVLDADTNVAKIVRLGKVACKVLDFTDGGEKYAVPLEYYVGGVKAATFIHSKEASLEDKFGNKRKVNVLGVRDCATYGTPEIDKWFDGRFVVSKTEDKSSKAVPEPVPDKPAQKSFSFSSTKSK